MHVTMKDIAAVANVSINTVSRALRDKADIGLPTRRRIRRISQMMGYQPNAMARGLVLKSSRTIGLAVTDMTNPVRSELIAWLRQEVERRGFQLLVTGLDEDLAGRQRSIDGLIERRVDGLVVGMVSDALAQDPCWAFLQNLGRMNLPMVVMGDLRDTRFDVVNLDYHAAADMLVTELTGRGYRRIALFANQTSSGRRTRRAAGYWEAMHRHGLAGQVCLLPYAQASLQGGLATIKAMLASGEPLPEALIAHNDLQAIGLMRGLREAGLRVPQDVAIAGFDNIEMGAFTQPALTTVGWDKAIIAATLADTLFARLKHGRPLEEPRVLAPTLAVRQSIGQAGVPGRP